MTVNVIRRRNTTIAVKFETTPGLDAFGGSAPSAATDFLKCDVDVSYNQAQNPNPELTGSLDQAAPIIGGTKATVTLTPMAKGSGTPGIAPQWGKLMQLCAYQEVITMAIAASAATAGTTSSATLGTGYATTAEAYQGMPAILTGNPAGPLETFITDYTAGKVALLAHQLPVALDATTMVAIPANVLYRPITDPALIKTATVVVFMDGLAWKFTGCAGTWTLDTTAGQAGTMKFTLNGRYSPPVAGTAPSGIVFDAAQPPTFRGGVARLGGQLVRINKASFDCGNTLYEPDNPEDPEGFDVSIITGRASKGSFDPLMSVSDTVARAAVFKAGGVQSAAIQLGNLAGNIVGFVAPTVLYSGLSPQNRSDLMAENLAFTCPGSNAGIFVTVA